MKNLYLLCLFSILTLTVDAQNLSSTMTISGGTSVSVVSGTTVYADNVNLKSTSDAYSSLLLNGALGASTIVNYDRFVNKEAAGTTTGNDLISLPVKLAGDVTFAEFLDYSADGGTTPNSTLILNSTVTPTLYAFGPYNNTAQAYVTYNALEAEDGNTLLTRATGYRAAIDEDEIPALETGRTLRFTGTVSTVTETVEISTGNNVWNLIGNPYPTYVDSQEFLAVNGDVLDPDAKAIYGYNSGNGPTSGRIRNFTIINDLVNSDINIAPGQGFLVANGPAATNTISFTMAMRLFSGSDDFILGRNNNISPMVRIKAANASTDFATEIYFNGNSTLGLDPGYDAALFNGSNYNFSLYSHLVENNVGRGMSIQSVGSSDIEDVIIPLGLKAGQGQQITFSIETSTLPAESQVYLEDTVTNTFTLLNTGNYTFTAATAISGAGRFYLRIGNSALSTVEQEGENLRLFASDQHIFIKGLLLADTAVSIFDIQGRLVLTAQLEEGSIENDIETASLNTGIYIVKLKNEIQEHTKKVIIK